MITGTRLKALMGTKASREKLKYEIISENYAEPEDIFQNQAMKDWILWEWWAKEEFESITFKTVEEVAFVRQSDFHWLSPDGIINNDGKYTEAIEIKSPQPTNFVKYCLENIVPKEYYWQAINYFLVLEDLEILNFVIYNPNVKGINNLHIIKVNRADLAKDIDKANKEILLFKKEVQDSIENLQIKN